MEKRTLGKSGIDVTKMGLGLWAAGGTEWGPSTDKEEMAAIDRVLEMGVTFFDTADVYGGGHSEDLLGKAMKGRRDQFLVATKLGWIGYDGKANRSAYDSVDQVVKSVEASLKRLQTDRVEVIQYHIPYKEANTDIVIEGFQKLVDQGKARAYGVSTSDFEFLKYFNRDGRCATLQIDYSILNRTPEKDIFPYCDENAIGIIVRGPIAMGILADKFTKDSRFGNDDFRRAWISDPDQNRQFLDDLAKVDALRKIITDQTLAQLALQFVMSNPVVTTVIPGAKNPVQAEQNTAAALFPDLSPGEAAAIDAIVPPGGGRKIWPA